MPTTSRDELSAKIDPLIDRKETPDLVFDEADKLLEQRTEIKDHHDRYSNSKVGNLLKRIFTQIRRLR